MAQAIKCKVFQGIKAGDIENDINRWLMGMSITIVNVSQSSARSDTSSLWVTITILYTE